MNVQLIPPSEPLLANMPSGRDVHTPKPYVPPSLDEDILIRMRAPPDHEDELQKAGDASSSDEEGRSKSSQDPVGAFPGTREAYTGGEREYY